MLTRLLLICMVVVSCYSFGQTTTDNEANALHEKGLRMITSVDCSKDQITKILAFNFDEYRRKDASVVIKIVDGPHLELFSRNRILTGELDPAQEMEVHQHDGDGHDHVPPSERPIKKFEIRVVDVFNTAER